MRKNTIVTYECISIVADAECARAVLADQKRGFCILPIGEIEQPIIRQAASRRIGRDHEERWNNHAAWNVAAVETTRNALPVRSLRKRADRARYAGAGHEFIVGDRRRRSALD